MSGGISTHVLDLGRGRPAAGVPVRLDRLDRRTGPPEPVETTAAAGPWVEISRARTDGNGRVAALLPPGEPLERAVYRLTFEVADLQPPDAGAAFFPEASVVFAVSHPAEHHHVPLLWSPFGYSTYRGG